MPDPIKPTAADDLPPLQDMLTHIFDDAGGSDALTTLLDEFGFESSRELAETLVLMAANGVEDIDHAQQAREQALEEAAVAMENLCFFTDIEELREMTKQDLSVRTCHKGAEAIRALKEQPPC